MLVAQMDGNKVFGEFWTALGVAPRPAFLLLVTVAMLLPAVEDDTPVKTISTKMEPQVDPSKRARSPSAESGFLIGGTVRDASVAGSPPMPGATVRLERFDAAGQRIGVATQVTNGDGRFVFDNVRQQAGDTYTLQAWTPTHAPTTPIPVEIPSVSGNYDLQMS
jgi:hypothetical protein